MYQRDIELIENLKLNAQGKYNRFSQGDVEYLILSLKALARYEKTSEIGKR